VPIVRGQPFGVGTLAVLRYGDGVTALASTGTAQHIVEISPVSGDVLQSIALPLAGGVVNGTFRGACAAQGTATSSFSYSAFANKLGLVVGCYSVGPGQATTTATIRTAAVIDWAGNVDTTTTFSQGTSEILNGIASADGSGFWLTGSQGVKYVARGAQRSPAVALSASATVRGSLVHSDGSLYAALGTSPYGVVKFPAPLPTTANPTLSVPTLIMPGTSAANLYVAGLHWDDVGSVYTVGYIGSIYGVLFKFNPDGAGGWVMAAGYPKLGADMVYTAPGASTATTPYGFKR